VFELFTAHLWGATPQVKSMAYRCVVCPIMEYGCQLWNPFTQKDIQLVENIQRRAGHWVAVAGGISLFFHGRNLQTTVCTCWDGHL